MSERKAVAAVLSSLAVSGTPCAVAAEHSNAASFYVARTSSVNAWHDLIKEPNHVEFVDAWVAVAALSHVLSPDRDQRLTWEVEGQVGYNFGDQSHWELNAAFGPRWHDFPWSDSVATSAAFLFGLSMASEVPEVEVELEGASEKLLIYWAAELTFGPPQENWAVLLRLHHRSGAFGLLADDGGMNAVGLGVRFTF
jgi:hypothetical protein